MSSYNPGAIEPDTDTDTDSDTDTDTDTDSDTDTDVEPISITDIDPDYGTSAGGTQVNITGGPFDSSAKVYFGDIAGSVLNASSDTLTVQTPSGTEGVVEVKVTTNTGLGSQSDAFTYWQDGTGLAGLTGELSWYHYVGDYWNDTPQDFGYAGVFFLIPVDFEYWEFFASSLDTCANNFIGETVQVYEPNYSSVELVGPSGSAVTLPQNNTYKYIYETQDSNVYTHFVQGGTYTVRTSQSSPWPTMEVTGALRTPNAFQVTQPALNSNIPPGVQQGFNLSWTGSGGDFVLVKLYRYEGSTLADEISCALRDDGSFSVPSSVWSGWSTNSQMTIVIGRANSGTGRLPNNNSDARAIGIYWVIGAGWTE